MVGICGTLRENRGGGVWHIFCGIGGYVLFIGGYRYHFGHRT